ncbi:hypothetical protein LZ480_13640 [Solibacillus sp. MA9]|uniref:Uncharacterized protein n=1 Tax=Solibacillus palustris TaxID=2908203 RepID=A0ABS9UF82_9BACL|nr:hypothetical protein [Solibacillus sp. MA9]MCH7322918.1 hypothetical protein [Solibacillus sp. MA9]
MRIKLIALIEVRKMITLLFAIVFAYLAVSGRIPVEYTLSILTMVFGYYFGKSTAQDGNSK